ncbi:hypothetical protein AOE01nite_10650 [Acetobacter oeni]|uniref:Uncharacterized protein n=1 Tax=Acetobacter oeni TaxID=304077 RepID=A0A511XIV5_9PROT|nr:hypothetical protein AOE01nite_10650 [Acetobacter oeni]
MSEPVAVVAPVVGHFFRSFRQIRQQNIGSFEITDLTCGQIKADRPALTVADSV